MLSYFISRPSVYTLPGTWEKQPLIGHGHYSGLWQEFCLKEAGHIVREIFFERLEAVRLYEENKAKEEANVYTSTPPESDSNAVATGESATT